MDSKKLDMVKQIAGQCLNSSLMDMPNICNSKQVIAAVFDYNNGSILQLGYNHSVVPGCNCKNYFSGHVVVKPGIGKVLDVKDISRPAIISPAKHNVIHKRFVEQYEVHAEMQALINYLCSPVHVLDPAIYCTLQPCQNCLKHIVAAGIKHVFWTKAYHDVPDMNKFIKNAGIEYERVLLN